MFSTVFWLKPIKAQAIFDSLVGYYYYSGDQQPVYGMLDEFGIWSRVLNETEIDIIYDDGAGPSGDPCPPIYSIDSVGINACDSVVVFGEFRDEVGWYSDTIVKSDCCDSIALIYLGITCENMDTLYTTIWDTAIIEIRDTVFSNIYDTIEVSVMDTVFIEIFDAIQVYSNFDKTDTLVINYTSSISNFEGEIEIMVYPNPTADRITLDCSIAGSISNFQFDITFGDGRLAFESYFISSKVHVSLSNLFGPGYYFLNIYNENGLKVATRKILLE